MDIATPSLDSRAAGRRKDAAEKGREVRQRAARVPHAVAESGDLGLAGAALGVLARR